MPNEDNRRCTEVQALSERIVNRKLSVIGVSATSFLWAEKDVTIEIVESYVSRYIPHKIMIMESARLFRRKHGKLEDDPTPPINEDQLNTLKKYDTVILLDDSGSMWSTDGLRIRKTRWEIVESLNV